MALKALADKNGIVPRRVAEVGVGRPENCYVRDFILADIPTILVEPLPAHVMALFAAYTHKNVTIFPVAVSESCGSATLYDSGCVVDGQQSFLSGTHAPCNVIYNYYGRPDRAISVVTVPFSAIDPGDIDVMNIDVEGSEWLVLKTLVSRPKIISVELYGASGFSNAYLAEIKQWFKDNDYREVEGGPDPGQTVTYMR